jgi:hypothetical protein
LDAIPGHLEISASWLESLKSKGIVTQEVQLLQELSTGWKELFG